MRHSRLVVVVVVAAFGVCACGLVADDASQPSASNASAASPSASTERSQPETPIPKPAPVALPGAGPRAIVATNNEVLAAYADGLHRFTPSLTEDTIVATGDYRTLKVDGGFAYLGGPTGIERMRLPSGPLERVASNVQWDFEVADGFVYTSEFTGGMESATGPCAVFWTPTSGGRTPATVYSRPDCAQGFDFLPVKGTLYVSRFSQVAHVPLLTDPVERTLQLPDGSAVRQLVAVGPLVIALSYRMSEGTSGLWNVSTLTPVAVSNDIAEFVDGVQAAGSRVALSTRSVDSTRAAIRSLVPQTRTLSAPVVELNVATSDRLVWAASEAAVYFATATEPLARAAFP